jgi:hypothetical protein
MENPTPQIHKVIAWLQKQAAEKNTSIVLNAQIAITPQEALLLRMRPELPTVVIQY